MTIETGLQSTGTGSTGLPNNQSFLLVDTADAFTAAHARIASADEAATAKARRRNKRMVTIPAGIALVVLLYCAFHGYIVWASSWPDCSDGAPSGSR